MKSFGSIVFILGALMCVQPGNAEGPSIGWVEMHASSVEQSTATSGVSARFSVGMQNADFAQQATGRGIAIGSIGLFATKPTQKNFADHWTLYE